MARCVIQRFLVPICAQISANFFANLHVPPVAHWAYLRDNARKAEIGVMVDSDLDVIETENQALTDRQKLIQDTLINSTFINGETIVPNLARGVTAW